MEQLEKKRCPDCNGENIVKFGTYLTRKGKYRKYRCTDCARVFIGEMLSENPFTSQQKD